MRKRVMQVLLLLLLIIAMCFAACGKESKNDLDAKQDTEQLGVLEIETSVEVDERIEQAAQEGLPQIVISNVKAKPGDKVTVAVAIVNNPGVLGMSMTLSYDESIMELIGVENGEAVSGVLEMSHSEKLKSGCIFLWDGEDISEEQISDGNILTLEFQISESASAGKTPVLLISDADGIVDRSLQSLDVAVDNGFITIQ